MCSTLFSFFFFSSRRRHTRSLCDWSSDVCSSDLIGESVLVDDAGRTVGQQRRAGEPVGAAERHVALYGLTRSEEHTSELQSHSDLVCRLLLEKKKKKKNHYYKTAS